MYDYYRLVRPADLFYKLGRELFDFAATGLRYDEADQKLVPTNDVGRAFIEYHCGRTDEEEIADAILRQWPEARFNITPDGVEPGKPSTPRRPTKPLSEVRRV